MKFWGPRFWMTPLLVAVNVAVFLVESILPPEALQNFQDIFALSLPGLLSGYLWELLSYAFLHANLTHILLNMLGLWFGGRMLEPYIGGWRILILYVFAALLGGIAQLLFSLGQSTLIGASGAVFGIIVAFAAIFPHADLIVVFLVLPVRLRARIMAWILIGYTVAFMTLGIMPYVGYAAHLGGALGGFLFARIGGFAAPSFIEQKLIRLGRRFLRR